MMTLERRILVLEERAGVGETGPPFDELWHCIIDPKTGQCAERRVQKWSVELGEYVEGEWEAGCLANRSDVNEDDCRFKDKGDEHGSATN